MPLISSERITLPFRDRGRQNEFVMKINYTTKRGCFYTKLPEELHGSIGKEVTGETESETRQRFFDALKEYKEADVTEEKVIIYKIEMTASIDNGKDWKHPDYEVVYKEDDLSFVEGIGISLFCDVKIRKEYNTSKFLETEYFETEHTIPQSVTRCDGHFRIKIDKECNVIPWTQEREEFFRRTALALEKMVLNIDKFFSEQDKFLQLVDSGKFLLESPNG